MPLPSPLPANPEWKATKAEEIAVYISLHSLQLCFFFPLMIVSQLQNDDLLLNIVTTCPKNTENSKHIGQIWVLSDFPAVVTLNCLNGNKTKKNHAEVSVKFFIGISSEQTNEKEDVCLMKKFPKYETYQVEVIVSRRYIPMLYHPKKRFAVICTYSPFAKARTRLLNVRFPSSVLRRIVNDKGEKKKCVIKMEVIKLNYEIVTGILPLGLKVQLRGQIRNIHEPFRIRVDRCIAFNQFRSYEILKDGCGDGVILPSDIGFTSFNQWFYSPIFESFHLRGSTHIQFECTVYFCDSPCRPRSCKNTTRPRFTNEIAPQASQDTHFKLDGKDFDVNLSTIQTE